MSKFKFITHRNFKLLLNKISILGLLLILLSTNMYAQFDNKSQTLKASSSGMNFAAEGKPEVNLYHGVVNISSSLGVLNGKNGSQLPIFQTYQSSGIKVQDYASIIGLGWKLNIISSVTRNVRGLADETPMGFFGGNKGNVVNNPLTQTIMNQIAEGNIDTEPDQFMMNINGMEMEFVFDKNGVPNFLTQNDYYFHQHPFQSGGGNLWIIKDIMGNRYSFGGDETAMESSSTKEYGRQNSQTVKSFISTWYLKSLYIKDKSETFNYTYFSGQPITYKYYKKTKVSAFINTSTFIRGNLFRRARFDVESEDLIDKTPWDSGYDLTINTPKYLKQITTSKEKIELIYNSNRQDLQGAYQLSNIYFKTNLNQLIKRLQFITSYRSSSNPTGIQYDTRMMLDKIKYFGENNSETIDLFNYNYNQINLPSRNSPQKDHWGYFTNSSPLWFPSETQNASKFKEPDNLLSKACILESITYPNGGGIKYYFESNDYFDPIINKTRLGGGVRIAKIEKILSTNNIAETINYNYKNENNISSGRISQEGFQYAYFIDNEQSSARALNGGFGAITPNRPVGTLGPLGIIIDTNVPSGIWNTGVGTPSLPFSATVNANINNYAALIFGFLNFLGNGSPSQTFTSPYNVISSDPVNDLNINNSGIVGYSMVTVFQLGNGKEINRFTDIVDYPDSYLQFSVDGNGKQFTVNDNPVYLSSLAPPFTPTTSQAFARGLLKQKIVFDNNNNVLKNDYNNYSIKPLGEPVTGLRCFLAKIQSFNLQAPTTNLNLGGRNVYYNVGTYRMQRKAIVLETSYSEAPLDVATSYTYDSDYPSLLIKESTMNSDGITNERNSFYVKNSSNNINYTLFEEAEALLTMQEEKQWGIKLGENSKANNVLLNATKVGFKNHQGNTLAFNNYESFNSGGFKLGVKQIQYDINGRVSSYIDDQLKSNLIWYDGSENTKLSASNVSANELFFENFETTGNSTVSHTGTKGFTGNFSINFTAPANGRSYKLSYWYLDNDIWKFSGLITYSNQQISGVLDDVCVAPDDSDINTFTYTPTHLVSSEINEQNQTTYYEYDTFQRLRYLKDQNKNILKAYCYNYAGQTINCFEDAPAVPIATTIYVKLVSDPEVYYSSGNYSETTQNFYLKFYSDEDCLIEYTLTEPLVVNMSTTTQWQDEFGSGQSGLSYPITVAAGERDYFLGNIRTSYNDLLYDDYYGYTYYLYGYTSIYLEAGVNYTIR